MLTMVKAPKRLLALALAMLPAVALGKRCTNSTLTFTEGALRMNHMQVVGSHNSYHIEAPIKEKAVQKSLDENAINFWYSHPQLDIQLGEQQMRNLEIDVLADPEGGNYAKPFIRRKAKLPFDDDPVWNEPGTKVLHVPDFDIHTVCKTLKSCLSIIRDWMDEHPQAVPIPIMMEFKTADREMNATNIPWDNEELLTGLEQEIVETLGRERLITPDDVRDPDLTLEESILTRGWPDMDSARGKIFFLMDNGESSLRKTYLRDRPNLEGRVLFTNSEPGMKSCAFQKVSTILSLIQSDAATDEISSTSPTQRQRSQTSRSRSPKTTGSAPAPTCPWTRSSRKSARPSSATTPFDLERRSCQRTSRRTA